MKRILILLAILALSSLACADPTADSLSVSSASGDPGDTEVLVLVNITNVIEGPLQTIGFDVVYDRDVIELVKARPGSDLPTDDGFLMWAAQLGTNKESIGLTTNDQSYALSNGTTGNIVKLYFNVVGTAGQTSSIELANIDISNTAHVRGTIPAINGTFTIPPVNGDPVLCTTPDPPSWNIGSVSPGAIETWTFDVANCGGAGTLAWTVSDDQDWITVSPESGSNAGTVTVTINTTGLSDGAYDGTVNVSSSYGTKTGTVSVTVQSAANPPPSIVTYMISNTTISPNGDGVMDTTAIDLEFSEPVSAAIMIENATDIIKTLYTGSDVTDPDPLVWDGTDGSGSTVPYGTYQVNVTMDDGVNPMVCDNPGSIIVANMSVATISIGDGGGIVTLPITIENGVDVGACDITLTFDPAVVNVTNVTGGDMDATFANLEHRSEGWVRIGTYQTTNPGLSGQITFANVTFESVGGGGNCSLNLSVTTFKDATPVGNPMPYIVVNGTYTAFLNGDVNDDGIVDIHDAMYLAKYAIGGQEGYDTINKEAADVNGDGLITTLDAMCLAKHVIGISEYAELK